MSKKRQKRGYWTIERSFEEAKKYQHRSDFKKNSNRAYTVLKKSGLLDKACAHMSKKDTIRIWTKDACVEAAKKCTTKSEFEIKYNGAYAISKRRGWYEELLQYFTPVGSKYKRCIYACEFSDNHVYVGLTYDLEKRKKAHLRDCDSAVFQYLKLTGLKPIFKQITEYIDYQEASIKEGVFLKKYEKDGWVVLNRCQTGGLGTVDTNFVRKWTKEKCITIAKNLSSYKEFNEKYKGAWSYAKRHGFLEEIKKILKPNYTPNKKWTVEIAIEECKKYQTIKEFQKNAPGAYNFMLKHGLQNEIRDNKILLQRDKWQYDEAKEIALKYKTKAEFKKNDGKCYKVAYKNGWLESICNHMVSGKQTKYNENDAIKILSNFSNMEQLKKNQDKEIRGIYWWLKQKKKIIEFKKYLEGDPLLAKKVAWTNNLILDEVKKYKCYSEYRANGRSYQYANLHGLLNDIKNYYKNGKIWF